MTCPEFNLLPKRERIKKVYHDGVYIGKKKLLDTILVLYQVESFYVEISYIEYRFHVLTIECFITVDILDNYADSVVDKSILLY